MFERGEVYPHGRGKGSSGIFSTGRVNGRRLKDVPEARLKYAAGQFTLLACGLLLGRAVLLGELLPFGAAFVAAGLAFYRKSSLAALPGAVLGLFTVSAGWDLAVHAASLAAVGAAALALPRRAARFRFLLSGTVFAVLVVIGTGYVAVTGPTTYAYVRVLFEAIFAALLALAYYDAFGGLQQVARRGYLPGEKIFCLVLLLASVVAGAGQVQWAGVSPGGALAGLVVMAAGHAGGAGLGAAAGAVMGVLPGLVFTVSPAAPGAFAFAGFLGGLCRGLGRLGVVTGFMLGNTLLTVYLGSNRDIAGVMGESAVAALVFLVVPAALFTALRQYLPSLNPWMVPGQGENSVFERVSRWGVVFEDISRIYGRIGAAPAETGEEEERRECVNQLRNMTCTGCALYRVCWDRELQSIRRALEDCFAAAENNGKAGEADLAEVLRQRCSRTGELLVGINCLYRMRQMKRYWEKSMQENRNLVSEHMRGMRGVVENLARAMEAESRPWRQRADQLKQELKQAGTPVAELALYPASGGCEVEIIMPACGGGQVCRYNVVPLVNRLTGMNLVQAGRNCPPGGSEDFCRIRLYPDLRYTLQLGAASAAGSGHPVCGDKYTILPLNGGLLAVMLSDGMGAGPAAAVESGAALALLQQLLKTGYGLELAIRTVNSVLMQRLPADHFVTVDVCLADLYAGKAKVVKIGASPSFHVRRNRVDVIRARSLPAGIVDEISIFSAEREFATGDMLVMVTDGVLDAYRGDGEREQWVTAVLEEIVDLPPQEVADLILRLAMSGSGGRHDDMTVLVARVEKPPPPDQVNPV